MKNYQCKRCGTVIQSSSFPRNSGCQAGSSHNWVSLGNVGGLNYQCKRCGIIIQSESTPSNIGCQEGSSHTWTRL